MRWAIIADIHANLSAFKAVLKDIKKRGRVDKILCLGDIVGYGPDPHECIETLCETDHICIPGNHDLAAIGKIKLDLFNPVAAAACQWTTRQLKPSDVEYLKKLVPVIEEGNFTLTHGSPRDPVWEYILSVSQAKENLSYFQTQFCLIGHSHVPLVFVCDKSGIVTTKRFSAKIKIEPGSDRIFINPGGLGQPRDGDSRAGYAIYDSQTGSMGPHRVSYDIAATQKRMTDAGLPLSLITRLKYGL